MIDTKSKVFSETSNLEVLKEEWFRLFNGCWGNCQNINA